MRALATLVLLVASPAWAQSLPQGSGATPQRQIGAPDGITGIIDPREQTGAGDMNWVPSTYGLSTAAGVPAVGVTGLSAQGTAARTTAVTPYLPPKAKTAVWKWADYQVCVTTCNGYSCDANQWQVCEGEACELKGRGCYAPWVPATAEQNGGFSVKPGTVADANACIGMILTKEATLCYQNR